MRWSWIYLLTRRALELAGLRLLGNTAKDVELLVLRHQLAVLQPQGGKPKLEPADRVLLAVLSRLPPRKRWDSFFVTPATLLRWVRREALRCIPDAVGRNSEGGSWVAELTWTRKREGKTACQGSRDHLEASGAGHREARAIWPRLDRLKPNPQR